MHTKGCFGSRAYALLVAKGTAVNCTVVSNVSTCADSSTKIFVGTAASFFKDYANGNSVNCPRRRQCDKICHINPSFEPLD